jgi:uncharacterized membrane protein YdbT with pleckstrin-like domain
MDEEAEIDEGAIEHEDYVEILASPKEINVRTWTVIIWVVGFYLLCGIPFFLFIFIPFPLTTLVNGLVFAITWVCGRVYGQLYQQNYRALITDKGILVRWGAITRNRAMIHFHRITDFSIHKGILYRIFGLNSIHIQTAGAGWAEGALIGVTEPEPIIKFLKHKIEENAARAAGDLGDTRRTPTSAISQKYESELLAEILDEMKKMNKHLNKLTTAKK